jgi:hypothetical protein
MARMIGAATIPCIVWPGWFSHERSIELDIPGIKNVVAFVDERDVIVAEEPTKEGGVKGRCRVYIVSMEGDSAIVDLPQPSIQSGTRFKIPARFVEAHAG